MKTLLLGASLCWLPLAGCTTDPDDKAFFYRGWVHPPTDAEEERQTYESLDTEHPPMKTDPLIDR